MTPEACNYEPECEECEECGSDIPAGYLFHYAHDQSCSLYDARSSNGLPSC